VVVLRRFGTSPACPGLALLLLLHVHDSPFSSLPPKSERRDEALIFLDDAEADAAADGEKDDDDDDGDGDEDGAGDVVRTPSPPVRRLDARIPLDDSESSCFRFCRRAT